MFISKQKIQQSLSNIRENPSIAEQLLYSNVSNPSSETGHLQFNPNSTKEYLNVIEDLFKKVKKTRKNKRESVEESDSDSSRKRHFRKRVKPQELELEMQEKINRKIAIEATQHEIESEDEPSEQQTKHQEKINKSLKEIYQKEMISLDDQIQSKNYIPINKSEVSLTMLPSQRISIDRNLHKSYQNDHEEEITKSKYLSTHQIQPNPETYLSTSQKESNFQTNEKRLELVFSDSDQEFESRQKKRHNAQNYEHNPDGSNPSLSLSNLILEIDKDIENLRDKANKNQNNHENSSKSLAFKTNYTSEIDGEEEYANQRQENNDNDKSKNNSGIYSFRNANKGTEKGESEFGLFDLPQERQKYDNINKKHNNEEENEKLRNKFRKKNEDKQRDSSNVNENVDEELLNDSNTESNAEELESLPYHTDYSLPLSQHKIQKLVSEIKKRIKTSYLVIDEIPFEHPTREDNNQLQIDARFIKENKDRKEIIEKIEGFLNQDNNSKKYQGMCVRYKGAKSLIGDQVVTPFEIDQAGKRKLKDAKIWRSPGKNLLINEKFKSLNSPMSSTKPCCFPPNPRVNLVHPAKSTASTSKNPHSKFAFNEITDSQLSEENELSDEELSFESLSVQSASEIGCVMQEQGWDKIKNIRKKMEERYERLLGQY